MGLMGKQINFWAKFSTKNEKKLELWKQISHLTRRNFLFPLLLPKFSSLQIQPPAIISNTILLVTETNPKGLRHGHAYYHSVFWKKINRTFQVKSNLGRSLPVGRVSFRIPEW